jgi:hypothetical protein
MVLLVLLLQLHSLQLLLSQLLLLLLDRLLLLIQWTCIHTSRASFFVIVAVSTKEYFPHSFLHSWLGMHGLYGVGYLTLLAFVIGNLLTLL